MATPMIANWKKIDASGDKEVDPTLYRQLIGSLVYLVNTRSNICYIVNILSQFMVELETTHWAMTKHILRYVRGTINFGLRYTKGDDIELSGFTNADWAGSSVGRESTVRYCFGIGSGMTSWGSEKQKFVALSSAKAEYMEASKATCEAILLRKLLVNLFTKRMEATKIFCDNQSCIKLFENPMFHDHSKHIDIRCHFIMDCVQRGAVQLEYTPIGNQLADVLTKALRRTKLVQFREQWVCWKIPFNSVMQHLRGSCSTVAAMAVAMSWVALQLQQQHSVGGSNSAERRCFRSRVACSWILLLEHFPR